MAKRVELMTILGNMVGTLTDSSARQEAREKRQARIAKKGSRIVIGIAVGGAAIYFGYAKISEVINKFQNPNSTPLSLPTQVTPIPTINSSNIVYCEIPGDAGPTKNGNRAVCEYPQGCDISNLSDPALFEHSRDAAGKISQYPITCKGLGPQDLEFKPIPTNSGVPDLLLHSTPPPKIEALLIGISCDKPGLSNIKVKGGYATCIWPPVRCNLPVENPIWMLIGVTGKKLNAEPSCQVLTQKDLGFK